MSTLMLAPTGSGLTVNAPSGTTYLIDANGYVVVTNPADVPPLVENGFRIFSAFNLGAFCVAKIIGANMNSTADQLFTMFQPIALPFRITKITCKNASTSLTTAAGGIYRAAAKAGPAMVAAAQAYSGLTAATLALDLTLATGTTVEPAGEQLYLSLTTAQGAAATADFYAFGDIYG
jgi:hypothetical protein